MVALRCYTFQTCIHALGHDKIIANFIALCSFSSLTMIVYASTGLCCSKVWQFSSSCSRRLFLYVLPPSVLPFISPLISLFSYIIAIFFFLFLSPFDGLSPGAYLLLFLLFALALPYMCTLFFCTHWGWFISVGCWMSSWVAVHSPPSLSITQSQNTLFMRKVMIDNDVEQSSKSPTIKWFDTSKKKVWSITKSHGNVVHNES